MTFESPTVRSRSSSMITWSERVVFFSARKSSSRLVNCAFSICSFWDKFDWALSNETFKKFRSSVIASIDALREFRSSRSSTTSFSTTDNSLNFSSNEVINSCASLASISAVSASSFQPSLSFVTISRSFSSWMIRVRCSSSSCWFLERFLRCSLSLAWAIVRSAVTSMIALLWFSWRMCWASVTSDSWAWRSSIACLKSLPSWIDCSSWFSFCSRVERVTSNSLSVLLKSSWSSTRSRIRPSISISKSALCSRNSSASTRNSEYSTWSFPKAIPPSESFSSAVSFHSSLCRHVSCSSDSSTADLFLRFSTSLWFSSAQTLHVSLSFFASSTSVSSCLITSRSSSASESRIARILRCSTTVLSSSALSSSRLLTKASISFA